MLTFWEETKEKVFIIFKCLSVAVSFFGGRNKIREFKFACPDLLFYAFWSKNNTYENASLAILALKTKTKIVDRSEEKSEDSFKRCKIITR